MGEVDSILEDAFFADSVPFHLTTREFYVMSREKLTDDGVFVANFIGHLRAELEWRSVGSAGSAFCMGEVGLTNVPVDAAGSPSGYYPMGSAGSATPAAVGSLDTTTAKDLAVTVQFSVNTAGTQITNHMHSLIALHS